MPTNRPKKLTYFADNDPFLLSEINKLESAIVFDTHGKELGFKIDDITGFATRTELVEPSDISISIMAKDRFVIFLSTSLAPETFINKTGPELWEVAFSFQPWSPIDSDTLVLPEYKALLTLTGIPPHLFHEKEVAKACATFGTFLDTIPRKDTSDIST